MINNRGESEKVNYEVKVYKRRWCILLLFTLYTIGSSAQWLQYSIIENIITSYYNVSSTVVNWTSMSFMLSFMILIIPAMYFVEKYGLRSSVLIGAFLLCFGSTLKVFSIDRTKFFIGFCGQIIVGISQVFMLGLPPKLASVWFPPEQLSTACSICFVALQAGAAIGFTMSTSVRIGTKSIEDFGTNFAYLFYSVAIYNGIILILILIFFQARPPIPPSPAEAKRLVNKNSSFFKSVKTLYKNSNFWLMIIASGINQGVYYGLSTLLNQILLRVFTNDEVFVGQIGNIFILCATIGSFIIGIILDKTHSFKTVSHLSNFVFAICVIGLSIANASGYKIAVIGVSIFMGISLGTSIVTLIEFSMEIFYPEDENTINGFLFMSFQIFGIIITTVWGWLLNNYPPYWSDIMCVSILIIGNIIIHKIPEKYLRQEAIKSTNEKNTKEALIVEMKLLSYNA